MNKKVMALAVAGALATPAVALAQVQIGGSIHFQYFDHDSGSPSSKSTDVMTLSEPEIYFRGEEKLGGGISTWFQCTSSFDVLGTAASSTTAISAASSSAAASPAQWCGRNSGIGFRGGFGNLFFGTWDTPQKLVVNQARGWWGGTNTLQGGTLVLLGNGAASNQGNTGSSFFRRQSRTMNYHSPNFSGFTVNAAVSAGNESTALSDGTPFKPRLYSLSGLFATGPFFAGVGYELHNDFNPGAVATQSQSDENFNVSLGMNLAGVKLSFLYMDNSYELGNAAGQTLDKQGYAVYLDWTITGPHKLYVQYGVVDDTKGNSTVTIGGYQPASATVATGGSVAGIAYGYSFSKRTQGYVAYNQLDNDAGAKFSFGTAAATMGQKQTVFGIGLRHSF
jgi:predicted porin